MIERDGFYAVRRTANYIYPTYHSVNRVEVWHGDPDGPEAELVMECDEALLKSIIAVLTAALHHKT